MLLWIRLVGLILILLMSPNKGLFFGCVRPFFEKHPAVWHFVWVLLFLSPVMGTSNIRFPEKELRRGGVNQKFGQRESLHVVPPGLFDMNSQDWANNILTVT